MPRIQARPGGGYDQGGSCAAERISDAESVFKVEPGDFTVGSAMELRGRESKG